MSVDWLDHESGLIQPSPLALLLEVNSASQVGLGCLLGEQPADTAGFHCQLGSRTRALRCACNRSLHRVPCHDSYLSPVGECWWRPPCCWPWVSSSSCWGGKADGLVPILVWCSLCSATLQGLRGERCSVFHPGRRRAAGACDGPLRKPAVEEKKSAGGATFLVWNGCRLLWDRSGSLVSHVYIFQSPSHGFHLHAPQLWTLDFQAGFFPGVDHL